jgi:gamma-glutamyltranspeptidase/glutathione hydrolase
MVSSAHPMATEAGLMILKKGGNAFDAAVAIAATLNVVEPMMSGMGGYGTILVYDAAKMKVRYLDSSGKIPKNVNSDVYRTPTPGFMDNRRGPKAISTPGNVNAWEAMSKEYGKLKWKDLFTRAIKIANEGFPVSRGMERMLSGSYESFPAHAKQFYGKNDRPLAEGELLVQKDLAKSLSMVAEKGSSIFYEGELAEMIHLEMQKQGSFLHIDDLIGDIAEWWDPIKINFRNFQVYTSSPPSTAFPSLLRLGMMSILDSLPLEHNSAEYLHYFAEISKQAFWCRLKYAGDPDINPPPIDMLLSNDYWKAKVDRIDPIKASDFQPPEVVFESDKNTTHFVVADKWGNIVSATQTLGNAFGSRIMPEGTGIWFNNSLAYCTFEPKGNPMDAKAGQRKLSGDCPTIIFKAGKPWAALGTPGGHTIGQTVPQMVLNLLNFNMNIMEAISAPRISFSEPNNLIVEREIPDTVYQDLEKLGHNLRKTGGLGNAHGLRIIYNTQGEISHFEGASDPRGKGLAKGY